MVEILLYGKCATIAATNDVTGRGDGTEMTSPLGGLASSCHSLAFLVPPIPP